MPASSKKKTSKTAKKSSKKTGAKKTTKTAKTAKKATKKAAKKTTKTAKTAKTASKAAPKKTTKAAKPGKPIRLDYLVEKLAEHHGGFGDFPSLEENLDRFLFSQVANAMPLADAKKAFTNLRTNFVDWNEVRISPVEEVRDNLKGADDALALAERLQAHLMYLFLEQHHVGLEFLREKTNAEIKAFFKKMGSVADSTVGLTLERLNGYPVVPLEASSMTFLERIGLAEPSTTALARQKGLYEKVSADQVYGLSLMIQDQARYTCPTDEEDLDCPDCALKRGCPFPAKVTPRQRTAAKKAKKSK